MDGYGGYYAKSNKPDRGKNTIWYNFLYVESKKIQQTSEYNKEEASSQM